MDDDTHGRISVQPDLANFLTPKDLQRELRIGERLAYRLLREGVITSTLPQSSTPDNSCKIRGSDARVEEGRPKIDISAEKRTSQDVNVKKGLPSSTSSTPAFGVPPEVAAFLADPPRWLVDQADQVRRDPAKLKPTCSSIAYEVYGTAHRWGEVLEAVQGWLEREVYGSEDVDVRKGQVGRDP